MSLGSAVSPCRLCLLWIHSLITTHHWGNRATKLFGQCFKVNVYRPDIASQSRSKHSEKKIYARHSVHHNWCSKKTV